MLKKVEFAFFFPWGGDSWRFRPARIMSTLPIFYKISGLTSAYATFESDLRRPIDKQSTPGSRRGAKFELTICLFLIC